MRYQFVFAGLAALFSVGWSNFEFFVGDINHESCSHVCKKHNRMCEASVYASFSCAVAAERLCQNPYIHEDITGGRAVCAQGGGCFINCAQWNYASIARWNGTCGYNWCRVGADESLRIVCPCSVPSTDDDDSFLSIQTTPAEFTGLAILIATSSLIVLRLCFCCCSLDLLKRNPYYRLVQEENEIELFIEENLSTPSSQIFWCLCCEPIKDCCCFLFRGCKKSLFRSCQRYQVGNPDKSKTRDTSLDISMMPMKPTDSISREEDEELGLDSVSAELSSSTATTAPIARGASLLPAKSESTGGPKLLLETPDSHSTASLSSYSPRASKSMAESRRQSSTGKAGGKNISSKLSGSASSRAASYTEKKAKKMHS